MNSPGDKPLLSCESCRRRKRKCDKGFPKCFLCSSKSLTCKYPGIARRTQDELQLQPRQTPLTTTSKSNSTSPLRNASSSAEPSTPPQNNSTFPSAFYLDWEVFRHHRLEVPKPLIIPLPPNISTLIGDPNNREDVASTFFTATHTWMPIISNQRFYENVLHVSSSRLRADYALLLLAMELICWVPGDRDPRTLCYVATKAFYVDLEIQGFVSLQVLQAGILIALFEFGHAIFPSAAVSVEACVRYGQALGIDWGSKSRAKIPFSWVDLEEENRVWWAVVILDHLTRIGYSRRPFLIEYPLSESILPADDITWDKGIMPSIKVGGFQSHPLESLGRFALTAEAIKLLGKVIMHIEATTFDDALHNEEALLLDRALQALATVVEVEGETHNLHVMNQIAICSIAMTMLHEAHISRRTAPSEYFKQHIAYLVDLVTTCIEEAAGEGPYTLLKSCVKSASPILPTLLYKIAISSLHKFNEESTSESAEALMSLKAGLKEFDRRWKAAGAYFKILEAREISCLR